MHLSTAKAWLCDTCVLRRQFSPSGLRDGRSRSQSARSNACLPSTSSKTYVRAHRRVCHSIHAVSQVACCTQLAVVYLMRALERVLALHIAGRHARVAARMCRHGQRA